MQGLLEVVRKSCLPGLWSEGVRLCREGKVARAGNGDESFRVRAPGRAVAPTVTLYPSDGEWSCDCGGKIDPCAHVAAAAIFSTQGGTNRAVEAKPAVAPARLLYRLGRRDRVLTLRRFVALPDGRETRLATNLGSEMARGRLPPGLSPTHEDLDVDMLLGAPAREIVPIGLIPRLLEALSRNPDVFFEDARVKTSGERIPPVAIVDDAPDGGFVLRMERDPSIDEPVALGVVRCQGTLRPIAEGETTGHLLERLPLSRTFKKDDRAELVTQVLPELEKRLHVTIRAASLPRADDSARPRIEMDLSHQGHTLSVLPKLVYGSPPIARVDGENLISLGSAVPVRRREEERALLTRLRDELNLVPGRRVDLDGTEASRFAVKLRNWQKRAGEHDEAKIFETRTLSARLDMEDGRFDVVFECAADGESAPPRRADATAVLRAWRDKLALVPLEGGGWAPLPEGFLEQHGHRIADLLGARDAEKRLPLAAMPELGALCEALDLPAPLDLARLSPLVENFTGIPTAVFPHITATLRAYQRVGVDWLCFLRDAELGAVLADDMGLGKTLQTICALRGRTLVVCPKSVVYGWAEEIARFAPGLRTAAYEGTKRELDPTVDVTITTYAVLRLDADRLAAEEWDVVVLDEAQAIKNSSSQTARAAFSLKGKFRVALSGTPVENRLEELWSVMHFANPGLLGGRSAFQERYVLPITNGRPDAGERLRAKIRPFVLRRMKREVVPELPPRTDSVVHVELDEAERTVYDAVRAATRKDVVERLAKGQGALVVLEALLRLRQAACHSALVPGQHAESSSKVDRLLEALSEAAADGHKALVFSQWTRLLDLIEPHLDAEGIRYTRLDGSTNDRGKVVGEFQADGGPEVMLVSLKAGGTGLNLTAADHVFLIDPWWNPAVEEQAADRAHRIGQERPVMVYRMVARDTVEERILTLKDRKRNLANVALGNADHGGAIT
ncbi:MAG TPA: DEAD/DEAH box helicase, partial [Polyangiaceae bacterium]|nr:DEAD/DEAH box helicase [Polyangiaceae bacterium]